MNKKDNRNKIDSYLKYSGLAFQMAAVILIAIFLGKKVKHIANSNRIDINPLHAGIYLL